MLEMMEDGSAIEMGTFETRRNVFVNVTKIFEVIWETCENEAGTYFWPKLGYGPTAVRETSLSTIVRPVLFGQVPQRTSLGGVYWPATFI